MFDRDYRITGKHATYCKYLCRPSAQTENDAFNNFKIFTYYTDCYLLCPIIGLEFNRKSEIDNSGNQEATIFADAFRKKRDEFKYVYQLIMLNDKDSEPDMDLRKERTFSFSEETDELKQKMKENMDIFNSYFRGGLEIIYDHFKDCEDDEEFIQSMHEFITEYYDDSKLDEIKEQFEKLIK